MQFKPCRHLNHDPDAFPSCVLKTDPNHPQVRYWKRQALPYPEAPRDVQFCRLRGRINNRYDCYIIWQHDEDYKGDTKEIDCWEACEEGEKKGSTSG